MATQATLPTAFVRKPAASSLKFKNHRKLPLHRLPFVDAVPDKIGWSFWSVPKSGGYFGGNETGSALARIYMKHLKAHGPGWGGGNLQMMALDMFDCENGVSAEQDTLRGQVVGFFVELEYWLAGAVKYLDGGLDKHDNTTLLKAANTGLNFDNEAYMASLSDDDEEA